MMHGIVQYMTRDLEEQVELLDSVLSGNKLLNTLLERSEVGAVNVERLEKKYDEKIRALDEKLQALQNGSALKIPVELPHRQQKPKHALQSDVTCLEQSVNAMHASMQTFSERFSSLELLIERQLSPRSTWSPRTTSEMVYI